MKNKFKHANISVAVATVLLVLNAVLFHGNEEAMSAGGVVALVVCFGLLFFLDEREYRARHSGDDRPD